MIFTNLISLFVTVVAVVATPIQPQQLDVISPAITSPNATARWTLGSTQRVVWETSKIPPSFATNRGMLVLGHLSTYTDSEGEQRVSENLNYTHPLASGFQIGAGSYDVVVPLDAPPRKDYIIVLFGDSGNRSPTFEIRK
ncbi:hypothetical protein R3P38DRAFT_2869924 [Favolaschia claudopus]|uniref:Uncharacterized protein n=1 Tax=Favolaschia claudopus TaxID=2862362 RepID=A0AAW0DAQ1_9AGAR